MSIALILSLIIHTGIILAIPGVQPVSAPSEEYMEVQLIRPGDTQAPPSSRQDFLVGVQSHINPITLDAPARLDIAEPEGPAPLKKSDFLTKADAIKNLEARANVPKVPLEEEQLSPSQSSKPLSEPIPSPETSVQKSTKDRTPEVPVVKEVPQAQDPILTALEQTLKPVLKQPEYAPIEDVSPAIQAPEESVTLRENMVLQKKEETVSKMQIPDPTLSYPQSDLPDPVNKRTKGDVIDRPTPNKETPPSQDKTMTPLEDLALPKQPAKLQKTLPKTEEPPINLPSEPVGRVTGEEPIVEKESSKSIPQNALELENKTDIQIVKENPNGKAMKDAKEIPQAKDKTSAVLDDPLLPRENLKSPESESVELTPPIRKPSETPPQVAIRKEPALSQESSKQIHVKYETIPLENKPDILINKDTPEAKTPEGNKEIPIVLDKNPTLVEPHTPVGTPDRSLLPKTPVQPEPELVAKPPVGISHPDSDKNILARTQEGSKEQKITSKDVETNLKSMSPSARPEIETARSLPLLDANQNVKEVPNTTDPLASLPSTAAPKKSSSSLQSGSDKLPLTESLISKIEPSTILLPDKGLTSDPSPSKQMAPLDMGISSSGESHKNAFGVPVSKEETRDASEKKELLLSPSPAEEFQQKDLLLPKNPPAKSLIEGPAGAREVLYQPILPKVDITVEGEVVLKFWILSDGTVGRAIPLKKVDTQLEQAAIHYIQKWRFAPLPEDASEEEQWGTISIKFKLK